MTRLLVVLLTMLPATALAGLGDRSHGAYFDVSGGMGAAYGMPTGVGAEIGAGGWVGKVDDAFAIGRTWSFGVRAHADFGFEPEVLNSRTALTVEFHRNIDLLVVGLRFGLQAGPVLRLPYGVPCAASDGGIRCYAQRTALGGTVLGDAALVYRFHRNWGLQLKGVLGVDIGTTEFPVVPVGGVLLGIAFEAPIRRAVEAVAPAEAPVDPDWSETFPGEP